MHGMETMYLEKIHLLAADRDQRNTQTTLLDPELALAEHLLAEAGIGFTEVARCPVAGCEICGPVAVEAAA